MRVPPVVAKSGGSPSFISGYNTKGLAALTSRIAVGFPSRKVSISVRISSKFVLQVSPNARMQSKPSVPPQACLHRLDSVSNFVGPGGNQDHIRISHGGACLLLV